MTEEHEGGLAANPVNAIKGVSFSMSITQKIGALFAALSLIFAGLLLTNSYLTKQLMGVSSAINDAGSERMRIYKLAYLVQRRLDTEAPLESGPGEIRREMQIFERVLEGLLYGSPNYAPLPLMNPSLDDRLDRIRDRWESSMRPALESILQRPPGQAKEETFDYTNHANEAVGDLFDMVQVLEQDAARKITFLYSLQLGFLGMASILLIGAVIILRRVIREPLRKLVDGAKQLASGSFETSIPIHQKDELGQLARTFEWMAERIAEKLAHLEALHATGQEISTLQPGRLEHVLRRIVDRAADLIETDVAILLVRHPILECWIVEAASGDIFEKTQKEILLLEEAPFSNQALETKTPVVVPDLSEHTDKPVRFRDEFGAKSYMSVPLLGPHEAFGVLALLSTSTIKQFSEHEIRVAQQFASYAAVTIENARLFEEAEERSRDLRAKLQKMERDIAELTHEVKAPAGRVAEFASWLEDDYQDRLDAKAMRYLEWIKKEGKDLAQLAERTLDFTRVMQEHRPLESVDANAVVREVVNEQCPANQITIQMKDDLPHFACRRIHLKQVIENLVNNAIKYMGSQPEPKIEVGAGRDDHGTYLYIKDNGIGIEPAMTERIFHPFQRLGMVEVSGAGIGLSIVRTVVEHYGGSITVSSVPGVGSTFYVRLPSMSEEQVNGARQSSERVS